MQPDLVTILPGTPVFGHADGGPGSAEPPYFVRTQDFAFILAEFEPKAARAALPAGLMLQEGEPGVLGAYSAPSGWGITPYTAFFAAIPVAGHDSPDGSRGYFMAEGYYSGRAGPVMHESYNRRLVPGHCRQWDDGTTWFSEAGPGTGHSVSIRVRPVLPAPEVPVTAGVHHYLGLRQDGGLNIYSVAYSAQFLPVADVSVSFTDEASPVLRSLNPLSIPYAALSNGAPLTFSAPRRLGVDAAQGHAGSAQVALVDVLSRLGRPAALVTAGRRVLFLNAEAEALLKDEGAGERPKVLHGKDLRQIDEAIRAGGVGNLPARPLLFQTANRARPLLAQVVPVSAALAGEPAALVLFADPEGSARTDAVPTLTLLGLTPAEARIAAQVGNGLTARQAAEVLSLAESTVRSSLQLIYHKLGIGKQSELARIVARLEGFGLPPRGRDQGVL